MEYLFADALMRRLSYAFILLPLLTCMASLFLGIVGLVLLMRSQYRMGRRTALASATLLAASPGIFLFGYIIVDATR